jgi:hypothetical protein
MAVGSRGRLVPFDLAQWPPLGRSDRCDMKPSDKPRPWIKMSRQNCRAPRRPAGSSKSAPTTYGRLSRNYAVACSEAVTGRR